MIRMDSRSFSLIIFSISCLLVLSSATSQCVSKDKKPVTSTKVSITDPSLTQLCDHTSNKVLCVSTLAPFLKGGKVDANAAIQVMIEACLDKTHAALEKAKKLPKGHGSAGVCVQVYDSAITDLESVKAALAKHDYYSANIKVSAVLTNAVSCDDAYDEEAGGGDYDAMVTTSATTSESSPTADVSNPMAGIDKEVQNLASNILAFTKLLK